MSPYSERTARAKTTLLHGLSGLLEKAGGRIVLDGREIDPASAECRRRSAFVLDDGGTIPLLTVEEQLHLAGALSGIESRQAEERTDALIRLLRLESHRRHRGDELSSGLRKRLGLGIGLIRNTEVFLFDEPFGALDVEAAALFIGIVGMLRKKGRIVVLASHTLPLGGSWCSRVWHLAGGRATDMACGPDVQRSLMESLDAGAPREADIGLPWIG